MKKSLAFIIAIFTCVSSFATIMPESLLSTFKTQFPEATNVSWFEDHRGFMAFYQTTSGASVRVYYDKHENFLSSMRYYKADQLPVNVRMAVAEAYQDCSIEGVTECTNDKGTTYVLMLDNGKKIYKVLFSASGEFLAELDRFRKAASN